MSQLATVGPRVEVGTVDRLRKRELAELCDAAAAAINDGAGFGWVRPPQPAAFERYWRGVTVVPERLLFVGRMDGVVAGSVQLVSAAPQKEAWRLSCLIDTHFVAPWARGHGLARLLLEAAEAEARARGYKVMNLSVRETQEAAIALYESLGFKALGHASQVCVRGRPIDRRSLLLQGPDQSDGPAAGRGAVILFPAIDLKGGACVRLVQGDMARATVFSDDPPAQARAFEAAGFAWLHIVDLDGAFAGKPVNDDAVGAILEAVDLPVQLGGGIRDMATIEAWLARGVHRVILGTVAVREPDLVRDACRAFPGRVAVGIDARDGPGRGGRLGGDGGHGGAGAGAAFRRCWRLCDYPYRHRARRGA